MEYYTIICAKHIHTNKEMLIDKRVIRFIEEYENDGNMIYYKNTNSMFTAFQKYILFYLFKTTDEYNTVIFSKHRIGQWYSKTVLKL